MASTPDEVVCVEIDEDLLDMVPGYLQNQRDSLPGLRAALAREDREALRSAGHRLKGSALMYGFQGLGELGARLEQGALGELEAVLEGIEHYLGTVQVQGRPF
jgi:HPt (histidine-containing phosphotransfer) domain-containing protein